MSESVVELLVRMDCPGCERNVRKALSKLKGVDDVDVDRERQKVTVVCNPSVNRMKVLYAARKAGGKGAEFWNPSQLPEEDYVVSYSQAPGAFAKTYNYEVHGYNLPLQQSTIYDDDDDTYMGNLRERRYYVDEEELVVYEEQLNPSTMFSDENPHGCSIM